MAAAKPFSFTVSGSGSIKSAVMIRSKIWPEVHIFHGYAYCEKKEEKEEEEELDNKIEQFKD